MGVLGLVSCRVLGFCGLFGVSLWSYLLWFGWLGAFACVGAYIPLPIGRVIFGGRLCILCSLPLSFSVCLLWPSLATPPYVLLRWLDCVLLVPLGVVWSFGHFFAGLCAFVVVVLAIFGIVRAGSRQLFL